MVELVEKEYFVSLEEISKLLPSPDKGKYIHTSKIRHGSWGSESGILVKI